MKTLAWFSDEMTQDMDFAGGTVVHVNLFALAALIGIGIGVAAVWVIKKKRKP